MDQLNDFMAARNNIDLSVLHLNARSLNKLLGSLDHSFSVIGVTETWLPK